MTNEQAAIQQAAREHRKRVRDDYVLRVVGAGLDTRAEYDEPAIAAAFHISRSEGERKRIQELERERDRLQEWRNSVSSAIKTIPEFHSGEWGGDKEGWGFHFEVVNWLRRTKEASEAEVLRLRGALEALVAEVRAEHSQDHECNLNAALYEAEAALQPVAATKEKG